MRYYESNDSVNEINELKISKEEVPYRFHLALSNDNLDIELLVKYNAEYDFFTLDLYIDSVLVRAGEKIIYGQALFEDIDVLPIIIPWDFSGTSKRVGYEELSENVTLVVIDDDFFQ